MQEVTRLFDILPHYAKSFKPKDDVLAGKDNGIFYAYGVSKTALNMLTVTESFDLKGDQVCVVALDPGWVRTELGGPNAHLAPEESAAACAELISGLKLAQSGKFLHYSGSEIAF